MKKNLTATIINEGRAATQEELLLLYQHLVCQVCPKLASTVKKSELARLVSIELYYRNVFIKDCNPHIIRAHLSVIAGVAKITIKRWVESVDFEEYARHHQNTT